MGHFGRGGPLILEAVVVEDRERAVGFNVHVVLAVERALEEANYFAGSRVG